MVYTSASLSACDLLLESDCNGVTTQLIIPLSGSSITKTPTSISIKTVTGASITITASQLVGTGLTIDDIYDAAVACGLAGEVPPVNLNIVPNTISTSAAGNTTNSMESVTVTNVGAAPGTWDGITLPVGAGLNYTAYLDPVTNEFKRINTMAYDASGTIFIIAELP